MPLPWDRHWPAIVRAVRGAESKEEALASVRRVMREDVVWNALDKAWCRREEGTAYKAIGTMDRSGFEDLEHWDGAVDEWDEPQDTEPGAPVFPVVPDGLTVTGTSSLQRVKDEHGNTILQWVKTGRDKATRLQATLDAVHEVAENFRGTADPIKPPPVSDQDLLAVYPWGDPHIGMYAWAEECGADFDLQIAEERMVGAVSYLAGQAPDAGEALLLTVGDTSHADNEAARTARSGNSLDVDTRWAKVQRAIVRTVQRSIDLLLKKHGHVRFIAERGNHDDQSALVLAMCLSYLYEREPRVTIDTSPERFHWYRFGKVLLGTTHGDQAKPKDLPLIMAYDRRVDWGETLHRHWYTGHLHHEIAKEYPGVIIETLRTLAGADAFHRGAGYRSGQDMRCDVWHRERGRVERHYVDVRYLETP